MIIDEKTEELIRAAIRSVLAGTRHPGYFNDTTDACTRAVIAALTEQTPTPDDANALVC